MKDIEYSKAATQVLEILNYTKKEDLIKIPKSFISFLYDISDKNYIPNFNHKKPINDLDLTIQAKELLGFIYVTWWSNENERGKYKRIIRSI